MFFSNLSQTLLGSTRSQAKNLGLNINPMEGTENSGPENRWAKIGQGEVW